MNNNSNPYFINRIIKLISPITCQTFKIELNGEENELRELLGTILEINPKSIKGLRDSYNNYYTLSSAVKNPHLNTDPYNYYTVVIKGIDQTNNIKYMKYPSLNLIKRDRMNMNSLSNSNISYRNNMINKSINYFGNNNYDENSHMNYYNDIKIGEDSDYCNIKEFLNFADDLYKRKYISHSLERKLKKLIKENNKEVLSILNPYLNLKSNKNYDELAKKIKPMINSGNSHSENLEETKQNSSLSSDNSEHTNNKNGKNNKKGKKTNNNTKKNNDDNKNKRLTDEEKILNDVKLNFTKERYAKLKDMLEKKDKEIIKIIKGFEKDNDYNHLLSKLSGLVLLSENSDEDDNEDQSDDNNEKNVVMGEENDSSYYIREEGNSKKSNKKNKDKKNKKKNNSEDIQKITKNICNSLKNKGKDLYYLAKYDLQKLKNDEKISLITKKFKLNIDKLKDNNYKIPKKNILAIKNYYTQYIVKKICKNFTDDEKLIYERLLEEEDEENNLIFQLFKELLNHKSINELRTQIKKVIKETAERIEEEENEEDEDENKGKNSIKEENEENEENEDEEEEEDEEGEGEEDEDGEGEEDEDDKDNDNEEKNSENKSNKNKDNSSSNKDNFILKDDNKDRAANLLNNNYRKINNFSNFANNNNNNNNGNNDNNNNNNDENKNNNNENNDNLGLGFVVVKKKKTSNKLEEKKDSGLNYQNNNDNNKSNITKSQAKESSQSTNNPNKKLNQFITTIEHLKKIDDIKKPIIEAIHTNNKYIMDLFQKFQKNKFNLNPKSLYAVYKQIQENPDTTSKYYIFKNLIKEVKSIDENIQEFLFDEFINKNSELETYYTLYDQSKEKDEFIESIEMFMNKPATKRSLIKFSLKKIKKEISPNLLQKNEEDNNEELVTKSKEIMKILKKYNLFNEKEYNIIMNSLENDDDVFTATFQVLFDDQDLNEFYETMTLALENQIKKDENKNEISEQDWNSDIIKKNFKELKKHIEEKHFDTLEELYKGRNNNLYNILNDINSTNIDKKVEMVKTLILKRELSAM